MSYDEYPWFKVSAALFKSPSVICATPKIFQKKQASRV